MSKSVKKRVKKQKRILKGRKIINKKTVFANSFSHKLKIKSKLLKIILFISLFTILIGTILGLSVYKVFFSKDIIDINIIGDEEITLEVFSEYEEQGIELFINEEDFSESIQYEGEVNTNKLGTYKVSYLYDSEVYGTRTIKVVDRIAPDIKLNGETEISLIETSNYNEAGAISTDNYDGDLTEKIVITGEVDTKKVGEYILTYIVSDASNNEAIITRKVKITEKPKVIIKSIAAEEKASIPSTPTAQPGLVTKMSFTDDGFSIDGCANIGVIPTSLSLNDINYNITTISNCYIGTLNLSNLNNGTYTLYINSASGKEKVVNNLDGLLKIKRAKVGNKLVTFDYSNNNVSISIQDFYYEYDVLIDVGHGGWDTGADNNYILEKNMNLIVSLYEKAKYEAAGLKVLMIRTDDSYGSGMGNFSKPLYNRAYYIGYYGVTSKVIYSNHHNSSYYSSASGFEMYVSNSMSNMSTELGIYAAVKGINKVGGIYARNYDTGDLHSKLGGQVYNYKNYYGILRIPSELFNVNNITIYEGCYLSNVDDYINYWNNENWKKISDIKVEYYISKIR